MTDSPTEYALLHTHRGETCEITASIDPNGAVLLVLPGGSPQRIPAARVAEGALLNEVDAYLTAFRDAVDTRIAVTADTHRRLEELGFKSVTPSAEKETTKCP